MPKCKNDSQRYFKGTEASPMGKGWCARGDVVGKVRLGTDGKQWRVAQTGTSKRWVHVVNSASVSRAANSANSADSIVSADFSVQDVNSDAVTGTSSRTQADNLPRTRTRTQARASTATSSHTRSPANGFFKVEPKFAIIKCSHTHRLLTADGRPNAEMCAVLESSEEVSLAFVAGDGAQILDFVSDSLPRTLERRESNEIVVKVVDPSHKPMQAIFTFIETLMTIYHCEFFRISTLSFMYYDATARVLTLSFDTI